MDDPRYFSAGGTGAEGESRSGSRSGVAVSFGLPSLRRSFRQLSLQWVSPDFLSNLFIIFFFLLLFPPDGLACTCARVRPRPVGDRERLLKVVRAFMNQHPVRGTRRGFEYRCIALDSEKRKGARFALLVGARLSGSFSVDLVLVVNRREPDERPAAKSTGLVKTRAYLPTRLALYRESGKRSVRTDDPLRARL